MFLTKSVFPPSFLKSALRKRRYWPIHFVKTNQLQRGWVLGLVQLSLIFRYRVSLSKHDIFKCMEMQEVLEALEVNHS